MRHFLRLGERILPVDSIENIFSLEGGGVRVVINGGVIDFDDPALTLDGVEQALVDCQSTAPRGLVPLGGSA